MTSSPSHRYPVPACDIETLEYRLAWYHRYACSPNAQKRSTQQAALDYGLQFERFIGQRFESRGWSVTYRGIKLGKNDGGIDLIARRQRKIRLVQCKCWLNITLGADVVSRMIGAVERFKWELQQQRHGSRTDIHGEIITTGTADEEACALAAAHDILLCQNIIKHPYPAIKAQKVGPDFGRFLIPFDKGYDTMSINPQKGDRYFTTIREAVAAGFFHGIYNRDILQKLCTMQS